jgi:hypothetical protein
MRHDAILICCGGVTEKGTLPLWVKTRVETALLHSNGTEWFLCLSFGTTHKRPVLDRKGFPVTEAAAVAQALRARGIPARRILLENISLDTIGNAYFSRAVHTDIRGFRRLLVVTSAFHMDRTREVFGWVFGLRPKRGYRLDFAAAPDAGLDAQTLAARLRRERQGLLQVRRLARRIRTMEQLHRWLFTEHEAYAVGLRPRQVVGRVKDSY